MVVSENGKIGSDGVVREFEEEERTKQQILIVDDSAMNRAILSEILKDDFEILEAENSEECLSLIEENGTGIALILLDIVMPGLDGFGVLEFMNKRYAMVSEQVVATFTYWCVDNIFYIMNQVKDKDELIKYLNFIRSYTLKYKKLINSNDIL